MLQIGALQDISLMNRGICEIGVLIEIQYT